MLERGSENLEAENERAWIPMCHLDLKPANSKLLLLSCLVAMMFILHCIVLIGDKDESHDISIFKVTKMIEVHQFEYPAD